MEGALHTTQHEDRDPNLVKASVGTLPFFNDPHYRAIAEFYGPRTAKRSGVLLINHIREGIYILERIDATLAAKQAYCLHPLFQGSEELGTQTPQSIDGFDKWALVLVLEYRNIANAYLSTRDITSISDIALSPLPEVQQMLIADKIQNRKDFENHHKTTHSRSAVLDQYFKNWLTRLGISEEFYLDIVKEMGDRP